MERITKGHPLSQSHDLVKGNIELLKELFPTIVKEAQIDWDELRAVLGEEIISGEEYYKFTWAGKSQAKIEANKLSTGTLRPARGKARIGTKPKIYLLRVIILKSLSFFKNHMQVKSNLFILTRLTIPEKTLCIKMTTLIT